MNSAVHEKRMARMGRVAEAQYRREVDLYVLTVFEDLGGEGREFLIDADLN